MDFVQWVNTLGVVLTAVGVTLQLKKDSSNLSLFATGLSVFITLATSGRIYGWW
jgi:hypothetical protein